MEFFVLHQPAIEEKWEKRPNKQHRRKRDASTEDSIMNVFPDKQFINFIISFIITHLISLFIFNLHNKKCREFEWEKR